MAERTDKGFTLIEVVMASAIFIIAAGIIGSFVADITQINFQSNRHTKAVVLAVNKLEELINAGYYNPLLEEGEYENPLNPVNATGDSSGKFYQFWYIEDSTPIPSSKRIISQVQWDDPNSETKHVTLTVLCFEKIE